MQISAKTTISNALLSGRSITLTITATLLLALGSNGYAMNAGTNEAELAPCPSSPNCVSSQATDKDHFVEALSGASTPAEARAALTQVLSGLKRVEWSATSDRRIQAAFTSLIFRFVDDVEFIIKDNGSVAIRSASRVGHSDLGANRNRVEMLREKFLQALIAPRKSNP